MHRAVGVLAVAVTLSACGGNAPTVSSGGASSQAPPSPSLSVSPSESTSPSSSPSPELRAPTDREADCFATGPVVEKMGPAAEEAQGLGPKAIRAIKRLGAGMQLLLF